MDIIQEKEGKEGIVIFRQAMSKVEPQVEVRSRRVGGATYQIPVDVRPERAEACAIRWLIISARARKREKYEFEACSRAYRCVQRTRRSSKKTR